MTPEQIKSTADAMLAHLDGEPVQYCGNITGEWVDSNSPSFNCIEGHYRRKPKPAVRRWNKPNDVPGPVCWIRGSDAECEMIIGIRPDFVRTAYATIDYSTLAFRYLHSTDRKTWHKCEVTE